MKNTYLFLLLLALGSIGLTSCQTISGGGGYRGGYNDSINDSSLYRSQDRTFRSN